MKKITAAIMSTVMTLALLVPSAFAQTEKQFYQQWYDDTSFKLAKVHYNWNPTGCDGCAGINEEFINAYEYYESIYPNSQYLAQYTSLYKNTVYLKAVYDAMDPSQHHIIASYSIGPVDGYFGPMEWKDSTGIAGYTFHTSEGYDIENVQARITDYGDLSNRSMANVGFVNWDVEVQNKDGEWVYAYSAVNLITDEDIGEYMDSYGFVTERYNYENPSAIMETFSVD